ncbi:MAG: 16S rRNA (cytosine(967)-C(5))-methyltransferase RsmB [Oscillospiraceae bacterium]|nr:16S rRNA (cytosine(967)-C(5))-methyltransferase RsmB [Oscillospiraceae bacterium]
MISSRQLAAEALLRVERGGYSQLVFDAVAKNAKLNERDTQFAAALFYGTLERKVTLDHCIARYSRHALSDVVAVILREAFYQLIYMESVPDHAAVDEAVELTRKMRQAKASGLVNGILRNFLRDEKKIPPVKGKKAAKLAIEGSCCESLAECFIEWYGDEKAREILLASFGRPPVYIRVNTTLTDADKLIERLKSEGVEAKKSGKLENCLLVSGDPAHTKAHEEGLFHIQDLCSQQAAVTLGAKPGEKILDICAAPGSKSFTIAEEMGNNGSILSCDVAEKRLKKVLDGAKRLKLTTIETKTNDGSKFNESFDKYDRILCDVPCSGLGVLRRKPEIKLRGKESFGALPELQYKILNTSAKYLKTGGVMVYSTCTINPEENERIVERFLKENSGFVPCPFDGDNFMVTNLPTADGGDGFFIARMEKK